MKILRHFTAFVKTFCALVFILTPEVASNAVVESFLQALTDLADNVLGVKHYTVNDSRRPPFYEAEFIKVF